MSFVFIGYGLLCLPAGIYTLAYLIARLKLQGLNIVNTISISPDV